MTWGRGRWRREKSLPSPARFSHFFLLNDFPPLPRSLEQATPTVICCLHPRSSSSIKIGIDLSLHKSIKIGKSDLIDIDCIDLACVASVSVLFPSKDRALVSFLARPKPRISFLGLSLLRNSTETLATQASIDQSVEIDDTLVSFIDLSRFYRFHPFISEDTSECSPVHPKMKTAFMQTVNLLTIE